MNKRFKTKLYKKEKKCHELTVFLLRISAELPKDIFINVVSG